MTTDPREAIRERWAKATEANRELYDEGDDMCPNCVTPWKCNGPHEIERTKSHKLGAPMMDAIAHAPTDIAWLLDQLTERDRRLGEIESWSQFHATGSPAQWVRGHDDARRQVRAILGTP